MSGTSLDGADAVIGDLSGLRPRVVSHAHVGFDDGLRKELLALTRTGSGEIDTAGRLGNLLATLYAQSIGDALAAVGLTGSRICAIGSHGQTIRHRPELGFTVQIGNPALLAELTGIAVVADFRSRDMAAGGQGAPLVPAFHAAVFADSLENRAVLNMGGIANITLLPRTGVVRGFDTGPGNCLMDLWAERHLGTPLDFDGAWAAGGTAIPQVLEQLLRDPYFYRSAPKSCGRELFNEHWLESALRGTEKPQAVQATLLELTVESVAGALEKEAPNPDRLIVCGGGAKNLSLMKRLSTRLAPMPVETSALHGLANDHVEATAFAWLAKQAMEGLPGNLPAVTGARGSRILGAIYQA